MTAIRSHFKPTKVEVKVGDKVYFHVTNLEQDFDIPHGFAIYGTLLPNILIMPGKQKLWYGNLKNQVYIPSIVLISVLHCIKKCNIIFVYPHKNKKVRLMPGYSFIRNNTIP